MLAIIFATLVVSFFFSFSFLPFGLATFGVVIFVAFPRSRPGSSYGYSGYRYRFGLRDVGAQRCQALKVLACLGRLVLGPVCLVVTFESGVTLRRLPSVSFTL